MKLISNSEMQRVFDPQNKRFRLFNHLRYHVDHLNPFFFLHFLPRRPKLDKIGERVLFETKRDEIFEPRSSKCDEKRARPEKFQFVRSDLCRDSFEIRDEKRSWF